MAAKAFDVARQTYEEEEGEDEEDHVNGIWDHDYDEHCPCMGCREKKHKEVPVEDVMAKVHEGLRRYREEGGVEERTEIRPKY